jgi:hypothetical protein
MWGNTLDYKLFNTLYMTHQYHSHTIKKLQEQAMALLEEANKINEWDMMTRHEIESHVWTISQSDLQQQIRKPQQVWVVVSPIPCFLIHLVNRTTLIVQPMDVTTLDANISASSVEISPTSNGTALSTPVEPVTK